MTIVRVGSTTKYADNFEQAFGGKKTAKKKPAKASAAKKSTKKKSKKKAAKK